MNKEEKSAEIINKFGQKALEYVQKTEDFMLDQAPEVFEEIIYFNMVKHSLFSIISLVIIAIAIYVIHKIWTGGKIYEFGIVNDKDKGFVSIFITLIVLVPSSALFFVQVTSALKAWLAPRLYIIEYLKNIVG